MRILLLAILISFSAKAEESWTVLIYMAADNDLNGFALKNIAEMESAKVSKKINILVQLDSLEVDVERIKIKNFSDQVSYTSKRDIRSPVIEKLPELDSANVKVLEDFLSWGVKSYPADHYMVVVWGHGQGYTSFKTREYGGVAFDYTSHTKLDMDGLKNALDDVRIEDLNGKPFDIFVTDACLMQTVEVISDLSREAQYIVGSTEIQPLYGLPYDSIFKELNNLKGEDSSYLLAQKIPKLFKDSLKPGSERVKDAKPEEFATISMSTVNSAEFMNRVIPALHAFGSAMVDYLKEDEDQLIQMKASLDLAVKLSPLTDIVGGFHDTTAFLTLMEELMSQYLNDQKRESKASETVIQSIQTVREAFDMAVLSRVSGDGFYDPKTNDPNGFTGISVLGFKGVSIWVPDSRDDYQNRIKDFKRSAFYKYNKGNNGWQKFLNLLFFK